MKKTILISGLIIILLISNAVFVRQMSEAQSTSGNRERFLSSKIVTPGDS